MSLILLVDDDVQGLESTRRILELEDYQVDVANDGQQALEMVRSRFSSGVTYDLIVTDVRMPTMGGLEFLRALKLCGQNIPVVLMTAFGRVEDAVWAMKWGAVDFLSKPFKRQALVTAVKTALQSTFASTNTSDYVSDSPGMQALKSQIQLVAPTAASVLILGESGTGKEKAAQLIHQLSQRNRQRFLAINCAAMPEALIEAELFGFEKGSFTGAHTAKAGLFEAADKGTLLLDEIGDMPLSLQAKLLRVLQEGEIRRIGATDPVRVDVRIIAATHQDLRKRVAEGAFRSDLLYRLEVITLKVPALRERPNDISIFVQHFLDKFSSLHQKNVHTISVQALAALTAHQWPGNIRELSNVIERAVILSTHSEIQPHDLPEHISKNSILKGLGMWAESIQVPLGTTLKEVEELLIQKTLEATDGDKNLTAKLLGLNSRTIYRKLESRQSQLSESPPEETSL